MSNIIRLVLDMIDYSDTIVDESFSKAFDSVEHHFLFHALENFGFGPFLSKQFNHLMQTVTVQSN